MRHLRSQSFPLRASIRAILFTTAMSATLSACAGSDTAKTEKFIYTTGRTVYKAGDQDNENIVSVIWDQGDYGFVRIERAEDSAQGKNDHPITLNPEEIRKILGQLKAKTGKKKASSVFGEEDLDKIVEPIAEGLSRAQPNQDVTFAVAGHHGKLAFLQSREVTTGRVFYKNGRLNLIFGLVHHNFDSELRATGILRPFTPGSRDEEIEKSWKIQPGEATQYAYAEREDWVQSRSESDIVKVGNTTSLLPSAGPVSTGQVPIYDQENPYYQDMENQLMGLLRLRRLDLITEEEYQKKRGQIINRL